MDSYATKIFWKIYCILKSKCTHRCPCYSTDTQNELELIKKMAKESGAFDAVICNHWAKGGAGATELAGAVERASQAQSNFKFLYDLNVSFFSMHKRSQ